MDYRDYEQGKQLTNFYFKAKRELIEQFLKDKKNLKILDIGAGTGNELKTLNKYGDVYVIDINKKALDLIPKNICIEKKLCDACKINYPNNYFDLVVGLDVFEHIPNDQKAFSEAKRVLKTDGHLLLTVPAFQFLFSSHDKALDHQRRYSKRQLKKRLKIFSKIKYLGYWNFLLFPPIALMRYLKRNSEASVDDFNVPILLNKLFYLFLNLENKLIRLKIKFPFGISLIAFVKN